MHRFFQIHKTSGREGTKNFLFFEISMFSVVNLYFLSFIYYIFLSYLWGVGGICATVHLWESGLGLRPSRLAASTLASRAILQVCELVFLVRKTAVKKVCIICKP